MPGDLRRGADHHRRDRHDGAARGRPRAARRRRRDRRGRRPGAHPARARGQGPRDRAVDDPGPRPQRRARHAARRPQLLLRDRLRPHEHLRLRDPGASPERARRHRPHGSPVRRPPQHRLHHVGRPSARRRRLRVVPRELPRHGEQHHQADGHDGRRRRRPRSHVEDRLRVPRRRRGAARQAVLHPVRRAGEPAAARPRGPRQASLLRRLGHPADLLAGADRRRHGADHPRRAHRPGGRRVALRRGHPPAPQARLAAASPAWARSSST